MVLIVTVFPVMVGSLQISRRPVGRGLRGLSVLQELQRGIPAQQSSPVSPRVGADSPPKEDTPEPATADTPAPTITPRESQN